MKPIALFASLILTATAHAGSASQLVLPASDFGAGWELSQPIIIGDSAAANYINRLLPHQPVVMVNIISFPSAKIAKERWDKKFGTPEAAKVVKKAKDMPEAYDYIPPAHNKRFILLGNHWLTVEQVGSKDDRAPFIQKYYELLKKKA